MTNGNSKNVAVRLSEDELAVLDSVPGESNSDRIRRVIRERGISDRLERRLIAGVSAAVGVDLKRLLVGYLEIMAESMKEVDTDLERRMRKLIEEHRPRSRPEA